MFCYSDTEAKSSYTGPSSYDLDPHKYYVNHFSNLLYLTFLTQHAQSTTLEKIQAGKEIEICHRKMKYWHDMPTFDIKVVETKLQELKNEWKDK